jgi:hypothetical protein
VVLFPSVSLRASPLTAGSTGIMRGSYGGAVFHCSKLHASGVVETFMPFVRCAAGRRNLAGTPFVPPPSPGRGKRRGSGAIWCAVTPPRALQPCARLADGGLHENAAHFMIAGLGAGVLAL